MAEFRGQTNVPIFAVQADLAIYAPDGLIEGLIAVTVLPFSFWMYKLTPPTADVQYIPAFPAKGGFWVRYSDLAEDVPYVDNVAPVSGSTNVQGVIDYIKGALGGGGVTNVTGSAPITSTGGATPDIAFEPTADVDMLGFKIVNVAEPTLNQDAATKFYVDNSSASGVPASRLLTAGAGLTGGGTLAADRTFDVVANADGSIVVNANDIQVGVLASDSQHGIRGGGTQHADATTSVAGFMSGADKTKLDGIAVGAASAILLWGNDSVTATTTTRYLTPCYGESTARTAPVQWRSPRAGTLTNLRVRQNTGAGNGLAIVYTIRINGTPSALAVSMASTANDGGPDTDTVAVAAGDLVDIEVTKAASVTATPSDIVASVELRT